MVNEFPKLIEYYRINKGYLCCEQVCFQSRDDAMYELIKIQLKDKEIFKTKKDAWDYYNNDQTPKKDALASFKDFKVRNEKDRNLLEFLKKYIINEIYNDEKQNSLFMIGECGTGKTFSMECLNSALKNKRIKTSFKNSNEIIDEIKNSFDTEFNEHQIISHYQKVPVLFLDDFGSERDTEFAKNVIYRIINHRYNNNMPTIISSNYDFKEIKNADIELKRIVDRIQDMSYTLSFKGENKRNKKMMEV